MVKKHVPYDKEKIASAKGISVEEQAIERVYDFAARELEYHDALNNLAAGEVDPHEIVNEAFARLLKIDATTPSLKPDSLLYQMVLKIMHEKVRKLEERERREVSTDANVKDAALENGFRTLGEHVLYFWQPDQDLKAADIIPDVTVPDPAEIEDMKTRQDELYGALDALPNQWRETFVLRAIEKMSSEDIALVHGTSMEIVEQQLADSQRFLMARMRDHGMLEDRRPDQGTHVHDRG